MRLLRECHPKELADFLKDRRGEGSFSAPRQLLVEERKNGGSYCGGRDLLEGSKFNQCLDNVAKIKKCFTLLQALLNFQIAENF